MAAQDDASRQDSYADLARQIARQRREVYLLAQCITEV
jgi:hypothetical protein